MGYRVFLQVQVFASFRTLPSTEKSKLIKLFDALVANPYLRGDYSEKDDVGRPIEVMVIGKHAVCFWADHAVKEVKVLEIRNADL